MKDKFTCYHHGIPLCCGKFPSSKTAGATKDNYMEYNVLLEHGECLPLYMAVPCGRCLLCQDKRAREWTTRATCETAAADYPPLFVTLTYEDAFLPHEGVQKRDVQLFLKRLRTNWKRTFGYALNLRYFLAAEYGGKTGRPHYHAQLWNIPNQGSNLFNPESILQFEAAKLQIQRAWSVEISKDEFDKTELYNRFSLTKVRYGKTVTVYYRHIGHVDVSPDRGNSAAYCMKYMHKPHAIGAGYMNPTFYLSSRHNGGIGIPYVRSHENEFRNNTWMTQLPGDVGNYALPRVFKEYLWPPPSKFINIDTRLTIERFCQLYYQLMPVVRKLSTIEGNQLDLTLEWRFDSIKKHYRTIFDEVTTFAHYYKSDDVVPSLDVDINVLDARAVNMVNDAIIGYDLCYQILRNSADKVSEMEKKLQFKIKRSSNMASLASTAPTVDVVAKRYEILQRRKKSEIKEVF